ncbi:MAG: sarcosine oxidase subunit delta [Steroidobacterales bacterium]
MLKIVCPNCGERQYTEFRYAGDATKIRPALDNGDMRTWHDHVFLFDNPKGAHREFWQHVLGCRQWLVLERNTATNEVRRSWLASDAEPGRSPRTEP